MNEEKKLAIFLTGYMGCGKTTLGKYIAQKTGLQFVDMDLFIENRYRKSINAIFEEKGEAEFRLIENRILKDVADFENVVVSTGGGLPCFFDNMEVMNRSGITVYLKTDRDILAERLFGAKDKRPLLKGKNRDELRDFVAKSLAEREKFYSQAQIIFDCDRLFLKNEFETRANELINRIYNI
ncbi:MAG: shikimate kinase [Dysgonamonadaceae bacterium]|jgi:shikimate kinase|nr:shikimate kinase [Dysgonamonadaceae bacterium]